MLVTVAEPLHLKYGAIFLLTSTDLVTIPKDLYKTHIKTAYIFAINKKVIK
jgi:hypothetical protein